MSGGREVIERDRIARLHSKSLPMRFIAKKTFTPLQSWEWRIVPRGYTWFSTKAKRVCVVDGSHLEPPPWTEECSVALHAIESAKDAERYRAHMAQGGDDE